MYTKILVNLYKLFCEIRTKIFVWGFVAPFTAFKVAAPFGGKNTHDTSREKKHVQWRLIK